MEPRRATANARRGRNRGRAGNGAAAVEPKVEAVGRQGKVRETLRQGSSTATDGDGETAMMMMRWVGARKRSRAWVTRVQEYCM